MPVLKVFEIHTYRNGAWKINSVFDDRDLAMMEAERMDRGNRYSAVRVVEETFDDETEKGNTRTIFRSSKAERINTATQARAQRGSRWQRRRRRRVRPSARSPWSSSWWWQASPSPPSAAAASC